MIFDITKIKATGGRNTTKLRCFFKQNPVTHLLNIEKRLLAHGRTERDNPYETQEMPT